MTRTMTELIFTLIAACMIIVPLASAAEKFKEAPINAYCSSPETYDAFRKTFRDDGGETMMAEINLALSVGQCVSLPFVFLFTPTGIVRDWPDGVDGHEYVLSGTIADGQTVYIWVDKAEMHVFMLGKEA